MTKEELLQDWLPRLMSALKDVRNKEFGSAEETIYELYVEMNQQTLAEKMSTFSEITLEDQMSAMAIELQSTQKRVADLENGICQRAFEVKQEQGEPVAWRAPNWGHSADDYVYRDFDDPVIGADGKPSPNNEPLYTTPQQRKPLTDEQIHEIYDAVARQEPYMGAVTRRNIVRAIEAAHGIKE